MNVEPLCRVLKTNIMYVNNTPIKKINETLFLVLKFKIYLREILYIPTIQHSVKNIYCSTQYIPLSSVERVYL